MHEVLQHEPYFENVNRNKYNPPLQDIRGESGDRYVNDSLRSRGCGKEALHRKWGSTHGLVISGIIITDMRRKKRHTN